MAGGLGAGQVLPVGSRPPTPPSLPAPMLRAFDKTDGTLVWERELPLRPAASPMTYLHQGRQFVVLAIGGATDARLVAFALPAASGGR
jgi:hypothetical protein